MPSSSLWSDLPRRLLTVSVGAPLVVAVLSHPTTSRIFFQSVHLLCCIEWIRLAPAASDTTDSSADDVARQKKTDGDTPPAASQPDSNTDTAAHQIPLSLQLFPIMSLLLSSISTAYLPLGISISSAILHLSSFADDTNPASPTAAASKIASRHAQHGLLYLSVSFHYLLKISASSFAHTIWFLFVVWNGDTGALVAGRMGRMVSKDDAMAKLCPETFIKFVKSVSPRKSMTGLFGGVVFGALTAIYWPAVMLRTQSLCLNMGIDDYPSTLKLFVGVGNKTRSYFDLDMVQNNGLLDFDELAIPSPIEGVLPEDLLASVTFRRALIGAVLSIFAIMGDLVESAVKRTSGQKDSGKLLPGHGGILDRFDSTFLAAVVYWHWCLA